MHEMVKQEVSTAAASVCHFSMDDAIAEMQKQFVIETGDLAGVFFSGVDWNALTDDERVLAICNWLAFELEAMDDEESER